MCKICICHAERETGVESGCSQNGNNHARCDDREAPMKVLSDLCTCESSHIAQKDIVTSEGAYPIFGASGWLKNIGSYAQPHEYIAVVKDGAGVGRVSLCPACSSVLGTMQYVIPREPTNIHFLFHLLRAAKLASYRTGSTIPHIYFSDYKSLVVPDVSIEEQEKIARRLDSICDCVALRERQIALFPQLAKSRFVYAADPVVEVAV